MARFRSGEATYRMYAKTVASANASAGISRIRMMVSRPINGVLMINRAVKTLMITGNDLRAAKYTIQIIKRPKPARHKCATHSAGPAIRNARPRMKGKKGGQNRKPKAGYWR